MPQRHTRCNQSSQRLNLKPMTLKTVQLQRRWCCLRIRQQKPAPHVHARQSVQRRIANAKSLHCHSSCAKLCKMHQVVNTRVQLKNRCNWCGKAVERTSATAVRGVHIIAICPQLRSGVSTCWPQTDNALPLPMEICKRILCKITDSVCELRVGKHSVARCRIRFVCMFK